MEQNTDKKLVGIITYHSHHNYGAVLQVFALSNAIIKLGCMCKVIDFCPEEEVSRSLQPPTSLREFPGYLLRLLFVFKHRAYREHFDSFIKENLPLTENQYRNSAELLSNPPIFDSYVSGSDQVWHPFLLEREYGLPFLLSFVPNGKRRIAYAPSFGVSEIPERYVSIMTEHLSRFDALSVREKSGQIIVEQLTGRIVDQVLDPTLLLSADTYLDIAVKPKITGDYVLIYPMETGTDECFLHLIRYARERLKIPFIFVFPSSYSNIWLSLADKLCLDAGPREFLGLVSNARFVLTNSFHGTVFSIIFRKPFLGVPHSSTNTRILGLLQTLGLSQRQVIDLDSIKNDPSAFEPFDYAPVQEQLNSEVSKSMEFLKRVL
jgi:hypothetical protein